ncbi:uncharacterized protein TNCT_96491 [Trichonephila clavata]|uniref:Uncharacterized protein n=1 Tax=Trichonephila clavata TaxID=2740835 RepID=A0A8X6KFY8_TRICU|nr:uncharacterized protein TNCT_96491 [Trichonephila clavata]
MNPLPDRFAKGKGAITNSIERGHTKGHWILVGKVQQMVQIATKREKKMESVLLLIMCTLILTMTAILIIFVSKIILRLLFERTWDSPFVCLQHNSPNIQIYIARTPGQHPYFRILEEYEQKMEDNNCKVEIGHTPN